MIVLETANATIVVNFKTLLWRHTGCNYALLAGSCCPETCRTPAAASLCICAQDEQQFVEIVITVTVQRM